MQLRELAVGALKGWLFLIDGVLKYYMMVNRRCTDYRWNRRSLCFVRSVTLDAILRYRRWRSAAAREVTAGFLDSVDRAQHAPQLHEAIVLIRQPNPACRLPRHRKSRISGHTTIAHSGLSIPPTGPIRSLTSEYLHRVVYQ